MLLPAKHVKIAESIVGFGSFVLSSLTEPQTIDTLWIKFISIRDTDIYPAYQSFDNLILAVDFLYAIGAVSIDSKGRLSRCA
jgi:hypothetical protein